MTSEVGEARSGADGAGVLAAPVSLLQPHFVEGARRQSLTRAGKRPRVVVIETGTSEIDSDQLDEELDVVARLASPLQLAELEAVLAVHQPRMILSKVSLDSFDYRLMKSCLAPRVRILVLARPVYGLLGVAHIHRFGGLPWLRLREPGRQWVGTLVKRAVDVLAVLLSAPLVLAVMLVAGAAICWDGPPLYLQERVGEGGRHFRLVKLRTMPVDAEWDTGPVLADANDSRVTPVGRILRRLRLDELPQLWNVLRGEMSLVGPRPERPEFIAEFRQLPHYDLRHLIRPGITGIAQLTGGYAATVDDKLRCDLLYVNCGSLRLDLRLLALTCADMLQGFPRG
ncbi:sugar transferase [Streptomyces sp. H10-C2]|uniref:sugar transferase n=1 Tax=unclassified Streptomyces TaxID=2593676 RepID=UPI0024BB6C63|nr:MULTISPECIES: sugar transferase [unclassified Streptomyces]MDJ0341181.1 sugar transferase [Streptomyces sp. PH10-H1]MDJ0369466.1 sugar transferase [Streptomyces sp. H10-C2]